MALGDESLDAGPSGVDDLGGWPQGELVDIDDLAAVVGGAVVAAVDGSEASVEAGEWAAREAELSGRTLVLLHATGESGLPPDVDAGAWGTAMRAEGAELLGVARSTVEASHQVAALRSVVVEGDPRAVLLEASEYADVVVLGSRGRGPLTSLLLGSVGLTLTQNARCPVVVARPREEGDDTPGDARSAGVLVGTDLTSQSGPAVEWAFKQADRHGMPLTLMHAVFDGRPPEVIAADDASHRYLRTRLQEVADQFRPRFPGVEVVCELRRGLADEALIQAATGTSMVVLGKHLRRSVLGMFDNDVPRRVLGHASRLVAVVPSKE